MKRRAAVNLAGLDGFGRLGKDQAAADGGMSNT
jgi:hypothetical protein